MTWRRRRVPSRLDGVAGRAACAPRRRRPRAGPRDHPAGHRPGRPEGAAADGVGSAVGTGAVATVGSRSRPDAVPAGSARGARPPDLPGVTGPRPEADADAATGRELDRVAGVGHRLVVLDARLEGPDAACRVARRGLLGRGRGRRRSGAESARLGRRSRRGAARRGGASAARASARGRRSAERRVVTGVLGCSRGVAAGPPTVVRWASGANGDDGPGRGWYGGVRCGPVACRGSAARGFSGWGSRSAGCWSSR